MKCEICEVELTGRQRQFCSDRCRMSYNRQNKGSQDGPGSLEKEKVVCMKPNGSEQIESEQAEANEVEQVAVEPALSESGVVTQVLEFAAECAQHQIEPALPEPGSLQHYLDNPAMYYPRQHPELLNWGKWMDSEELLHAKLKANRIVEPGDWDYIGKGL